jgi:RNA polymerase sigma factor (sigma-70 family)
MTLPTKSSVNAARASHRLQEFPDRVLCDECLVGNEEAWATLLERYRNLIYSIPLKFHFSPEEAADIFQAVALDLFTDLQTVRNQEKLGNWLISVARHRCLRHKERRLVDSSRPLDLDSLGMLPDPKLAADEVLSQVQEENLLREAVAELPARCRDLVQWFFYSDPPPTYDDVARRMGVAKNSVGFIRERCLRKLRALMEARGFSLRRSRPAPPLRDPHVTAESRPVL